MMILHILGIYFLSFAIDFIDLKVAYNLNFMPQLKLKWCWFTFINQEKNYFFAWIHQFIWLHVLTFHIHMNIYVQEIYAHNWKGEIRIPKYNFYYGNAHKSFVARVFTKHTPKRYAVSIMLSIYGAKWYLLVYFDMVLYAFYVYKMLFVPFNRHVTYWLRKQYFNVTLSFPNLLCA